MTYQESVERALRAAFCRGDADAVKRINEWLLDIRKRS